MKFKDDCQVPYSAEYAKAPLPLDELMTEAIKAFNDVAKMIEEQIIPTVQALCKCLAPILMQISQVIVEDKRVVYLAKHGKKWRTRKKNINRMIKDFKRRAKYESKSNS